MTFNLIQPLTFFLNKERLQTSKLIAFDHRILSLRVKYQIIAVVQLLLYTSVFLYQCYGNSLLIQLRIKNNLKKLRLKGFFGSDNNLNIR